MLRISSKKKKFSPAMLDLLEKIQQNYIALSADMSELISLIKKEDPEYKKQIEDME